MMSVLDLIKSKGLDDYHYATLSTPNCTPDTLLDCFMRVVAICRDHKSQVGIKTNANGLNPIRVIFDWRVLWYNANGTKSGSWGNELDALLEICEEFGGGDFIIQDEWVGYVLDADGNVSKEYNIGG